MARHAIVELRALIERHRKQTEEFVAASRQWIDLAEQYLAIDARVVAEEYDALRSKGRRHKEAVLQLALKYERTTKRIEQLIRTAGAVAAVVGRPDGNGKK